MKKFLVLYRGPRSAAEQMANTTPEQMKAGMDAWMGWAGKAGPAIADFGMPLGAPHRVGQATSGSSDGHVGGYSIMQGESREDVLRALDGHPHLMAPGASIEILEGLSMPGM